MEIGFALIFGIFALFFSIGFYYASKKEQKRWTEILKDFGRKHSLDFRNDDDKGLAALTGRMKGKPLYLYLENVKQGKQTILSAGCRIALESRQASELRIEAENFFSGIDKKLSGKSDIEVNTPRFDERALVSGPGTHLVRALLHPEAKSIIARLLGDEFNRNFIISGGTVQCTYSVGGIKDLPGLQSHVDRLCRLAELLDRPEAPAELLRQNYLAEFSAEAKQAYLESLASIGGALSKKDPVIEDALESRHSPLRIEALKSMGNAGADLLPDVFRTANESERVMLISYCAKRNWDSCFDFLHSKRDGFSVGERQALFRYYEITGRSAAEEFLQEQLRGCGSYPIAYREACIKALGRCGTYDSINVLNEFKARGLKREKDQAIAAVQNRIGAGDSGWLSVGGSEDKDGRLAISEDTNESDENENGESR